MIRRNIQGILVGSALAIVTTALYPVIKDTLRPLAYDLKKANEILGCVDKRRHRGHSRRGKVRTDEKKS